MWKAACVTAGQVVHSTPSGALQACESCRFQAAGSAQCGRTAAGPALLHAGSCRRLATRSHRALIGSCRGAASGRAATSGGRPRSPGPARRTAWRPLYGTLLVCMKRSKGRDSLLAPYAELLLRSAHIARRPLRRGAQGSQGLGRRAARTGGSLVGRHLRRLDAAAGGGGAERMPAGSPAEPAAHLPCRGGRPSWPRGARVGCSLPILKCLCRRGTGLLMRGLSCMGWCGSCLAVYSVRWCFLQMQPRAAGGRATLFVLASEQAQRGLDGERNGPPTGALANKTKTIISRQVSVWSNADSGLQMLARVGVPLPSQPESPAGCCDIVAHGRELGCQRCQRALPPCGWRWPFARPTRRSSRPATAAGAAVAASMQERPWQHAH